MKMKELLLAQLDRESGYTRRALELVPEGHGGWKPHEKSMPLGQLATMIASMPGWIEIAIRDDETDIAPKEGPGDAPPEMRTARELVKGLAEAVAKGRAALEETNDEHLMTPWKLLAAGRLIQERPRYLAILEGVFHHMAHHRGQLTVYLRLLGAKVPAIYGPSADEGPRPS